MAQSVREQIVERLLEAVRVERHDKRIGHVGADRAPFGSRDPVEALRARAQHHRDVDHLRTDRQLALAGPRDDEQVGGEAGHPVDLLDG